jgi:hypothetical protein
MLNTVIGMAGTIAENIKSIDNQANEVLVAVDSAIAGTIAESELKVLAKAKQPQDRYYIL